jgi:NAD(P)-dependent dehydrogenase (short-subunit alcohol dehydrogenase family)
VRSVRELAQLRGRHALVTGGAGHVGRAAGEALSELGAIVAISDVDPEASEQRVNELNAVSPGSAVARAFDLGDEEATRTAVRAIVGEFGGLDIIVHCAAFVGTTQYRGWAVPFHEQTVDAWERALRINLTAAFVVAQEARAALERSPGSSVILVASTYGLVGPDLRLYEGTTMANPAAYGASKGGLLQLTRYLATVLAPAVRVNAISPGGLWRNQPEQFRQKYEARTPLRRMGQAEDLKGAIAYLASDLSAYVTGHNLVVDGGWTSW